jgi:hypothetical protein
MFRMVRIAEELRATYRGGNALGLADTVALCAMEIGGDEGRGTGALLRRVDVYIKWLCDWAQPHVKKYARRNWITLAKVRNWTIEELCLRVITCLSWHCPNQCLILKAIILLGNCDRDRCIPDVILIDFNSGTGWIGDNFDCLSYGCR